MDQEIRGLARQLDADPEDPLARRLLEQAHRRLDPKAETIDDYLISEELLDAPFPTYAALHKARGQRVALMFVSLTHAQRSAYEDRLGILQELSHPGLVGLRSWGELEATEGEEPLFLVLDPIENWRLASCLGGPVPRDLALRLFEQAARAFALAHRAGLCCSFGVRDSLRIEHLIIDPDFLPHTTAFLKPPLEPPRLTRDAISYPSPISVAPEQLRGGDPDPLADQYALGALLYQALTGRAPFEGRHTFELMHAILNQEPAAPSAINPVLDQACDELVARSLAKDPADRFPSCEDFAEALEDARLSPPEPWWRRLWPRS